MGRREERDREEARKEGGRKRRDTYLYSFTWLFIVSSCIVKGMNLFLFVSFLFLVFVLFVPLILSSLPFRFISYNLLIILLMAYLPNITHHISLHFIGHTYINSIFLSSIKILSSLTCDCIIWKNARDLVKHFYTLSLIVNVSLTSLISLYPISLSFPYHLYSLSILSPLSTLYPHCPLDPLLSLIIVSIPSILSILSILSISRLYPCPLTSRLPSSPSFL